MLGSTHTPFSIDSLLDRFGGKAAIVDQVLQEFAEQAAGDVVSLTRSIPAHDGRETASVAHALKGAAGLLSAWKLHGLAGELEQMGRSGESQGAQACLAQVKNEVDECLAYITVARAQIGAAICRTQ